MKNTKFYTSRHCSRLLAALILTLFAFVLTACNQQSQPTPIVATTTPTAQAVATTTPTAQAAATATPTVATPTPPPSTNNASGGGPPDGQPTSWVHLSIAGALSGTLTITGVASALPLQQGENPVLLSFSVGDTQNGGLLLRLHNYAGPGQYPLHGCMGCGNKDDLLVATGGGQDNAWIIGNTDYDTDCTVNINSDTSSPYGNLHEVQGFIDCGTLYLVTDSLQTITCAGHFDVFVEVPLGI
jgi:hypothetical protein